MDPNPGVRAELDVRRRARNDLIAIGVGAVVAFAVLAKLDAFESFADWSRAHESLQVDEVLVLGFVVALGFAIFALRRWRDLARTQSLQRAAEHSARRLEGLLPICSGCKRIREQGGEWTPVEQYFSARISADFTHGLCPECRVRLYPGIPTS